MAQRRNQQQIVLPSPEQVGTVILRGAATFCRRNKVVASTYALGLLFLIVFGGGGRALTQQQTREYNRIMDTIDVEAEYAATQDYWQARQAYQHTKGWFWSCDSMCQRNKKRMQDKEQILSEIRKEGAARTSDAKSIAGLFSEVGVGEVQDSFWGYFNSGKQFAKRQTMWDAMFMGLRTMTRGRDESWLEFAIKILIQVLLNFSMGLIMALVFFIIGLWSIITSYQPNPIVAVIFFCGAAAAAFSFVTTYLLGMFGVAAGGVYTVLKVAEGAANNRIDDGRGRQGRVQYGGARPHYD